MFRKPSQIQQQMQQQQQQQQSLSTCLLAALLVHLTMTKRSNHTAISVSGHKYLVKYRNTQIHLSCTGCGTASHKQESCSGVILASSSWICCECGAPRRINSEPVKLSRPKIMRCRHTEIDLIQEIKLCIRDRNPSLPGYSTIRKDREYGREGVIKKIKITFIKKDTPFTTKSNQDAQRESLFEMLKVKICDASLYNITSQTFTAHLLEVHYKVMNSRNYNFLMQRTH